MQKPGKRILAEDSPEKGRVEAYNLVILVKVCQTAGSVPDIMFP